MAEIKTTFQQLSDGKFSSLAHPESKKNWLLEGLYPSLPVEIARIAETYLTLLAGVANKTNGVDLQFARSGLLRQIRPNDRLDYVRKQFSNWSELPDLPKLPKTSRLIKRLGIGSNDFDIKWGKKMEFSEDDEEFFSRILFDTGLSFFGGLAIMPIDEIELGKLKILAAEKKAGELKDGGNLIEERVTPDNWRHAFFLLPNGVSVDIGYGKRKENYVGEIIFNVGGKDIFMIHTGSNVYSEQKMFTDTRSGDDVSDKSQLAINLRVKNAPPLTLNARDLFEAKYTVDGPAHIKASLIPPESLLVNAVHEALRDLRTCGIFFPGLMDNDNQFIERVFDRSTWSYLRRVFNEAREVFRRDGHQKFIPESMQAEFIKDQAVAFNANPYDALVLAIMTDNLRIFPFFADVPVYFFYRLLTSDTLTHELVRDETNVDLRTRLPKYQRNLTSIARQKAHWLKTEYPGLKLILNASVGKPRNVEKGGDKMTVEDLEELFEKEPGILTFNPTSDYSTYFIEEINYSGLFKDKVQVMNKLIETASIVIPFNSVQKVSQALLRFIDKRERSFIYWDSLLNELNIHESQIDDIKRFYYDSGLMTPLGEVDSNIATFTPPEILSEIWDDRIKIPSARVENLVGGIIKSDKELLDAISPMRIETAAHLFSKYYLRKVYPTAAAIFYRPPSIYDLRIQANNLMEWASGEYTNDNKVSNGNK